eukprot:5830238-Pyramimonas_sp.AAC.1
MRSRPWSKASSSTWQRGHVALCLQQGADEVDEEGGERGGKVQVSVEHHHVMSRIVASHLEARCQHLGDIVQLSDGQIAVVYIEKIYAVSIQFQYYS